MTESKCPPHDWDMVLKGSVGTETTYICKCKREGCDVEIEVDV
jgi:hypothetical protein